MGAMEPKRVWPWVVRIGSIGSNSVQSFPPGWISPWPAWWEYHEASWQRLYQWQAGGSGCDSDRPGSCLDKGAKVSYCSVNPEVLSGQRAQLPPQPHHKSAQRSSWNIKNEAWERTEFLNVEHHGSLNQVPCPSRNGLHRGRFGGLQGHTYIIDGIILE